MDDMSKVSPIMASGPAEFEHWYDFAEGGPVHQVLLPFPSTKPAPFELARWSVTPGTSNDFDVHRSREVWIIVSGTGTLSWADQTKVLRAGDVVAFESKVPHQIRNNGSEVLLAMSVYWLQADD
jgi:mannose-6-phosphate isomerase-like protein (cupin superfamily)